MATQPPFAFLESLVHRLDPLLTPALEEARRCLVLALNHVLKQEPQALQRLARQKGCVVQVRWRHFELALRTTPAGLLDLADPASPADLTLTLSEASPWSLVRSVLDTGKPQVSIAGDVQLAAEINWVADHVRWDAEEDLARLLGDVPAHALADSGRAVIRAVRAFVTRQSASSPAGPSA